MTAQRRRGAPVGQSNARKRRPGAASRPRRSRARLLVWLAIWLAYAAIMWFFVFPWVDRTFVNRPAL